MATDAYTVGQNENIHILRGKGIGGVKTELLKTEKKDRKERKALRVLSGPAEHLVSTTVEASSLKQKSSRHGAKTTKKAQMSNILTDDGTEKCFEWEEEEIEKVHFTGNDMLKHDRDAMAKRVKEEVDIVLSSMGSWNQIVYDFPMPVKKIDDDIEKITMLDLEPEILLPSPTISQASDSDESILGEPDIPWESFEHTFEFRLKEGSEDVDQIATVSTSVIRQLGSRWRDSGDGGAGERRTAGFTTPTS